MTERRKLIFDALEKIYFSNKELKIEGSTKKVYAKILCKGGYVWHFVVDLATGKSYISRRESVKKYGHYVNLFVEYPLLFTDEQKETYIENSEEDFIHVAEQLIISWERIRFTIMRKRNDLELRVNNLKMSSELDKLLELKKQMIGQINEQIISEKLKNFIA